MSSCQIHPHGITANGFFVPFDSISSINHKNKDIYITIDDYGLFPILDSNDETVFKELEISFNQYHHNNF